MPEVDTNFISSYMGTLKEVDGSIQEINKRLIERNTLRQNIDKLKNIRFTIKDINKNILDVLEKNKYTRKWKKQQKEEE